MAIIYKLFDGEECVYVGQSKNVGTMYGRFSSHSKDKVFSSTSWEEVPDDDVDEAEYSLINELMPKYNSMIRMSDDFITKSELMVMVDEAIEVILKNANDGSNGFTKGRVKRIHIVHAHKLRNELLHFAEEYSENFILYRIERK